MGIAATKPTITRKELESVLDCLIRDELLSGNAVKGFEAGISSLTGVKNALAVNSLTSAYHLAYMALGIREGDEVIMPAYFDPAPLSALRLTGGRAILADIDEGALIPTPENIRSRITGKTKALVIGHTLGFHSSLDPFRELGIPLIEDISHALGAEIDEKSVGQAGTITVASFSPSMMITTGNGAMVLTANTRFYSQMKESRGPVGTESPGYDYTMTDFQGAMGLSQLSRLHDFIRRRREIARIYFEALKFTTHKTLHVYSEGFVYPFFPVLFDASIEKAERYWRKGGIDIFRPVHPPLHHFLGMRGLDYPNSDRLSKKLYSLPIYPTLTRKEIEKISRTLSKFI